MAKEAVAWMEQHQTEAFFLNYWMFSVHAPFDAKPELIEKHRPRVDPSDPQRCPTYAAMIESMDDAIGTLLDALDRLQLSDRTIIIFTADNGGNMYNEVDGTTPTSNAPLRGGKATLFEGGVRVPCVIAWPGLVQPGSRSNVIVQSEDYYPTLAEGLALAPQPDQQFDGVSILRALKGEPCERGPVFNYFPHDPGVPDWLPPAVAVHAGDWKLIRIFHGGDGGAHRWKLFNLREDLGEQHDLASQQPDRVRELDALIEKFLTDTRAVLPIPNPAFDPTRHRPEEEGKSKPRSTPKAKNSAKTPAKDVSDPALKGWKARSCSASVAAGVVTVRGDGDAPFLGVGAGTAGPAVLSLRCRCSAGGPGNVAWLQAGAPQEAGNSVPFAIAPGDWQTITVETPARGPIGILRVYLPAQQQPVEVDWIELKSDAKNQRWDF